MHGMGKFADEGGDLFSDLIPDNVAFGKGELPLAYRDPFQAAQARHNPEQAPDIAPIAGVKVFDFSKQADIDQLQLLVQQVAYGYCRFDVFSLQYESGIFKAFVVWTLYQRMPTANVNLMKQRAWEVLRRSTKNGTR